MSYFVIFTLCCTGHITSHVPVHTLLIGSAILTTVGSVNKAMSRFGLFEISDDTKIGLGLCCDVRPSSFNS